MANTVQIKRGNNTSVNAYTGPSGEIIYNLDTGRLHAQDGATAGGKPHALVSDVDLKANAAVNIIAGDGLTGGGTLAASRTLALNSTSIASLAKADSSVQTVNGVAPTGGNVSVSAEEVRLQDSRSSAILESFPGSVNFVQTAGYSTAGDGGGALYRRVSTEPSHAGKFQSADGVWWELASWPVNVKMFGAKGDGVSDDTQAFKDSYDFFQTGTDYHGGTLYIPRGNYILTDTILFVGFNSSTNFWLVGDGILNTTLDFSQSPSGSDGVVFRGSGQCGVSKFMITGAPGRGLVLNDNKDAFLQFVTASEIRIQQCGYDGLYSENSWNVHLSDIWSRDNGGNGVNLTGNHTSVVADKVFCSNNAGNGHRINGAIYLRYNGQSDNNSFYGYDLSNIRSGVFTALGTEYNTRSAVRIQTGVNLDGIIPEYRGFSGVVFEGMFSLHNGNNTYSNTFQVETNNSVPAKFTVIGLEEDVTGGVSSVTYDGSNGPITVTYISTALKSTTVQAGIVKIEDVSSLF